METIIHEFNALLTIWWILALFNIILIDIVMSWDNAIIIGMATRNLPSNLRKKAILIWIFLATVMRIGFASIAVYLMSIVGLKFAWWVLLLYVVWKFYKEIRNTHKHHEDHSEWQKAKSWFMAAVTTIIIADVSMSLDNVLAVAWAAWENIVALGIWLIVSIILMAVASSFIANKLEKYPQIQWLWLLVILFVAMGMIMEGSHEIQAWFNLAHINLIPFIIFIIWWAGFLLHDKYIKPMEEEKLKTWIGNRYMEIIIFNVLILTLMAFFGDKIKSFLFSHYSVLYGFLLIIIFVLIELISIMRLKRKSR